MRILFSIIRHNVFANVVLTAILVGGVVSAFGMIREFFPEFSVDVIQVAVPYPGADPEEVEEGICQKLEDAVDGLEGVRRYNTVARENVGTLFVELAEGYELDKFSDDIRAAVDAVSNWPPDSEKPIITELTWREEVVSLALWGNLSERDLKEWAEIIKEDLQLLPEISQVSILGLRDYEISIELSEESRRKYGFTASEVAAMVQANTTNLAAGAIRTRGEEIRVRTIGRKYTGEEFAKIPVITRPTGDVITLDRIATIRDAFTEDRLEATFNGEPAAMVSVFKTSEEDAIAISEAVRRYAEKKSVEFPEGIHATVWTDRSVLIEDRINLLLVNGAIGLLLVFLLLWLFLELRLAFWVAMGIPISLAGALIVMWWQGETINMITLFGMIMVLGIIVDDAIVIGEAIYVHRRHGEGQLHSSVAGVSEVGLPVIASVLTTVVAFIPLMFVSGVMGKFIAVMPVVVIGALLVSLIEALFLLPAHLNHLPDLNRDPGLDHPWKRRAMHIRQRIGNAIEWFAADVYGPVASFVVQWRYIVVSIAFAIVFLMVGALQGGFLKFIMFPPVDGNDLIASIEFPEGTPVDVTQDAVLETRDAIERVAQRVKTKSGDPLIRNIYTVAGESGIGFDRQIGSQYGDVRIEMLNTEDRDIYFQDIAVMWENEIGKIPGALAQRFNGTAFGPPGAPIELWMRGRDLEELKASAEAIVEKLHTYDGVYQITHDFRQGKKEMRLRLKPEAYPLGITIADVAGQLYAGYFGDEAVRLQRGRDDVRVKVRYLEDERRSPADLANVRIRTRFGQDVPILSLADISYAPGYSTIIRTDGLRRIKVTAQVDTRRANAEEVLADLRVNYLPGFHEKYPGLVSSFAGANQDTREAMASLKTGFPLALIGIFVVMATIFRSYLQPLIILFTVPFGFIGALIGHLIMGFDVTILSMFGLVALSGVVVNDAIVYIEAVNERLAHGTPFHDALRDAGVRRFRAIILTTVTTVGGLLPLIIEQDLQAQFLIPMALSIAAGVPFATLLTLLFLPSLLHILNDFRRVVRYALYREWPSPEAVEPAISRSTGDQPAPPIPRQPQPAGK